MKIFIGLENVASLYHEYSMGFRALGHEVFTVTDVDRQHFGLASVDLPIPALVEEKLRRERTADPARREHWANVYRKMAWEKALESDICLFIWKTFRPDASDIVELKRRGKKVIIRFCGSEVRDFDVAEQCRQHYDMAPTNQENDPCVHRFPENLHYLRLAELHADLLLCGSEMSLRPFYSSSNILDIPSIPHNPEQRTEPVLLHAPTDWAKKGTAEWLQIFAALRSAGLKFGVKFCEGLRHDEFIQEYAGADIYCGSLYTAGKADLEALAAGCVVFSYWEPYQEELFAWYIRQLAKALSLNPDQEAFARECLLSQCIHSVKNGIPIVPARRASLIEDLAGLILDYDRRCMLATAGRPFVEKYCSPETECGAILQILKDPDCLKSQFLQLVPYFFNLYYKPGSDPSRIEIFNRYTGMVRNTPWYKLYTQPGERNGLKF